MMNIYSMTVAIIVNGRVTTQVVECYEQNRRHYGRGFSAPSRMELMELIQRNLNKQLAA